MSKWSPSKSNPSAEPSSGMLTKYIPVKIPIIAIELPGDLNYEKWGGKQVGKKGDWLVEKENDIYTIDKESFKNTYKSNGDNNQYIKIAPIYAIQSEGPGSIKTKEGTTNYKKDDWIVYNDKSGKDGYSLTDKQMKKMYTKSKHWSDK